jgi:hypothetical protein
MLVLTVQDHLEPFATISEGSHGLLAAVVSEVRDPFGGGGLLVRQAPPPQPYRRTIAITDNRTTGQGFVRIGSPTRGTAELSRGRQWRSQ